MADARDFRRRQANERRGRLAEHIAAIWLIAKGYRLLDRRLKTPGGEIDLLLRHRDTLVFVEVKARSSESWTRPAAAVNAAKQRRIVATAREYVRMLPDEEVPTRFDIVEVLLDEGRVGEVRHQPNAFAPARSHR